MKFSLLGAACAIVAGLTGASAAFADSLYQQDKQYCMSGQADEARALCLKEAAAAQAERQRGGSHATHHAKRSMNNPAAAPAPAPAASS